MSTAQEIVEINTRKRIIRNFENTMYLIIGYDNKFYHLAKHPCSYPARMVETKDDHEIWEELYHVKLSNYQERRSLNVTSNR